MTTDHLLPRVDYPRVHSSELKDGDLLGEPPRVVDERVRQVLKAACSQAAHSSPRTSAAKDPIQAG